MTKYFTGTGDNGTSTFYGSAERHPKTDRRFSVLGSADELNSYLGICRAHASDAKLAALLKQLQEDLFILQAEIGSAATPPAKFISEEKVKALENSIEGFGAIVGELHSFVIPGGTPLSAHLDYARTLARKVERDAVSLEAEIGRPALAYLNRLSSLLFVLARFANASQNMKEEGPSYS